MHAKSLQLCVTLCDPMDWGQQAPYFFYFWYSFCIYEIKSLLVRVLLSQFIFDTNIVDIYFILFILEWNHVYFVYIISDLSIGGPFKVLPVGIISYSEHFLLSITIKYSRIICVFPAQQSLYLCVCSVT